MAHLSLALAQMNPIVGDIKGNCALIHSNWLEAKQQGADLVAFPELSLCGYPPEDLVLRPAFQEACRRASEQLARDCSDGPALLVGLPWKEKGLYNAYALLQKGEISDVRFKVDLPNYGVFDEKRVFTSGPLPEPVVFQGLKLGLPICEDIWNEAVIDHLARHQPDLVIVPNASPYWRGKNRQRLDIAQARVKTLKTSMVYLNQVGGQDELVFDGGSFILGADGQTIAQYPVFRTGLYFTQWSGQPLMCLQASPTLLPDSDKADYNKSDYKACMLGLRDYVRKNRFPGVVLGLSGGIDSALCAALAVDALGAEHVHAVMLPSKFTSQTSLEDAATCAEKLGIRYDILPIHLAVQGLENSLSPLFKNLPSDVTEENLQSRARGALLMGISNKFGAMVVTTGNKSEMSVGYATLYGDMNGGFNPIKDLYKTEVFQLCALRNHWKPNDALGPKGEVIPVSILTKAPSAELRDNQIDQDSLPPYDILDGILRCLIEKDMSLTDIIASGYESEVVRKVERLLRLAEYKRRQSAPGVKVTSRNLGRDRRYPIVNGFEEV